MELKVLLDLKVFKVLPVRDLLAEQVLKVSKVLLDLKVTKVVKALLVLIRL